MELVQHGLVVFAFPAVVLCHVVHVEALSGQLIVVIVVGHDQIDGHLISPGGQAFHHLVHIDIGEVARLHAVTPFAIGAEHILVGRGEVVQSGCVHVLGLRADNAVDAECPAPRCIIDSVHTFAQSELVFIARVGEDEGEVVTVLDALFNLGGHGQFLVFGHHFVDFLCGEVVRLVRVAGRVGVVCGLQVLSAFSSGHTFVGQVNGSHFVGMLEEFERFDTLFRAIGGGSQCVDHFDNSVKVGGIALFKQCGTRVIGFRDACLDGANHLLVEILLHGVKPFLQQFECEVKVLAHVLDAEAVHAGPVAALVMDTEGERPVYDEGLDGVHVIAFVEVLAGTGGCVRHHDIGLLTDADIPIAPSFRVDILRQEVFVETIVEGMLNAFLRVVQENIGAYTFTQAVLLADGP